MRRLKRAFAFPLALLFLLSLAPFTTLAAGENYTIKVNKPAVGLTYGAWQIFEPSASPPGQYVLTSNFASFDYDHDGNISTDPLGAADDALMLWLADPARTADDVKALMDALITAIGDGSITADETETGSAAGVEFTGLDAGYWLVAWVDSGVIQPADSYLVTLSAQTVDGTDTLEINPKFEVPEVSKEVSNDTDSWNASTAAWESETDASVGDTLHFRITATVPNLTNMLAAIDNPSTFGYKYVITDTLTNLTYVDSSLAITYDDGLSSVEISETANDFADDNEYKLEISSGVITVTFNPGYILGLSQEGGVTADTDLGEFIVIYEATLAAAAIDATPQMHGSNSAFITFGNNPLDDGGTDDTPSADTTIFTYGFDVFKYESITASKTPLAGAVFSLYSDSSLTEPIEFYEETGYYRPVIGTEAAAALISPAGGV
ncbi:MAG: isopeptide-forming domain-containing fimbrial protein, partial [Oscillospiraceae bacterium]|nr:isopeptide-forming domain-containing fimbrial protein [Oscillospiraceae bacterium]